MAAFASIEAPAAVKLMQLEERFKITETRVAHNELDIAEIKKRLDDKEHNQ